MYEAHNPPKYFFIMQLFRLRDDEIYYFARLHTLVGGKGTWAENITGFQFAYVI